MSSDWRWRNIRPGWRFFLNTSRGGGADNYTFTVTNSGANSLISIKITVPSEFNVETAMSYSCPEGWSSTITSTYLKCETTNPSYFLSSENSANIFLNATSNDPISDSIYTWVVDTTDNTWSPSQNTDAKTTVDITAPTTSDNAPTGWQGDDVTVILTPDDGTGSGVTDNTHYCIYNSGETVCDPTTNGIKGVSVAVTCSADSVCEQYIRYYSIDDVDNAEEVVKTSGIIQIDKKAPVTSIAVGDPKHETELVYVKSTTEFTLSATDIDSGVAITNYQIDEGDVIDYSTTGAFTVPVGTQSVTYWSVDNVNNTETTQTVSVFVDDIDPSVDAVIIDPIYNTSYVPATVSISATITETGSMMAGCEYTLNADAGEPTWINKTIDPDITYANGNCSVSNVDTFGASSINIKAIDNVGNAGTGNAVAVTVDTIAPIFSNITITEDTPTNDNTPIISFNVSDEESGVKADTIKISVGASDYIPIYNAETEFYSTTLPAQIDGTYTFTISASDNIGNSASDSTSLTDYVIDTVKPTTSDDYKIKTGVWQNGNQTITLIPSDELSGIAWTRYCLVDGCNPADGTGYTEPITIPTEGTTYFRYASKDSAGNVQATVSLEVKIDKIAPDTSAITEPTTDSYVKGNITITADAIDNTGGSGIAKVEFYHGENLIGTDLDNTDSTYSVDWNTTGVIDATYSLTAVAIDEAGNSLTSSVVSVTIDNTPPTIITYTIDNAAFSPNDDAVKDTANIDLLFSETVDYNIKIKSGETTVKSWTGTALNPNPKNWDGTGIDGITVASEGVYTLEITITDRAGTVLTNTSKTIEIDTTPPSVSVYTLDGGEADIYFNPNATSTDIVLTASETVDWGYSKVQHIEYGPSAYFPEKTDESEKGKLQMTRNWDGKISGIISDDGEYRMVEVKMTDGAGNISIIAALESYHMFVDSMDPVLTEFNSPAADAVYTTDVPLIFTATDTNLDVCSYSIVGVASHDVSCIENVTIPVANLSEGRNEIVLTVTDLAGNTVSADSVSFVYNGDGILTVDDTPGTNPDFATIQAAINAAAINDTISVAEGIYNENLIVDKKLTIQSSGITASTTINALNSSDYVVNITANEVTLDGFTITGYAATETGSNGAVNINAKDYCTITNNILTDNRHNAINLRSIGGEYSDYNTISNNVINAPNGYETYGIKIKGSHNTISDNEIYNADTSIHIWSWNDSETASPDHNTISGNTIAQGTDGTANHKYGIEIKTGRDNEVTGNTISVTRAGIHLYTSSAMKAEEDFDPRPANNIISDNTITGGEVGICLLEGANTNTISGNIISETTIAGILGSLSRWPSDWSIDSSSHLVGTPQAYLQITGNTFKDNSLDNCGHGIAMEYADNNIIGQSGHGNTIKNNTDIADINYNGVAFTADSAAIYFDAKSSGNIVNYNTITDNTNGLGNANAATIDATGNWWGSESGPIHSSNTGGTGDTVSNNVSFRSWYTVADTSTILDETDPTITISSSSDSPTKVSPVPIIITFDENVTDLTAGEIVVTNGTKGALTGSGKVYGINVTPTTDGAITVNVAAEVAWDLAGNYNTVASQFSITYDGTVPTLSPVTIASNNTGTTLAKVGDVITLSFTSSEEIQTPTVTIAGHPVSAIDGGSDNWTATYTMTNSDTEEAIAFTINYKDTAGNDGGEVTSVTNGSIVTFDKTPPAITLTSIAGNDYINNSEKGDVHIIGTAEADSTVNVSLTGGATVSGSGTATGGTYDITIDGTTLTEGTITPSVTATDAAGNVSAAIISPTAIKDVVAPTLTSKVPKADAIGIDTFADITVVFDEDIVISASNVVLKKTSDGIPIDTTVTFDSDTNTATINPPSTLDNNTKYNVALSGIKDTAGNDLVGTGATWDFTTATSYEISLLSGWNLISLPVTPTNWTSISDVLTSANPNNEVESVWTYNADQGKWYSYSATGGDINAISTMEAGMGYWIKMNGTGTLTGSGTLYEQLVPTGDAPSGNLPQVQLGAGWNMIGYYQLPDEITASIANALSKIDGAWSGSSADIITFEKGTLEVIPSVATMNPGTGYWIFMNKADIYSFGAATPQ